MSSKKPSKKINKKYSKQTPFFFKKKQLSYAVGAALSLGASAALLPHTAQAQAAGDGESIEEVIITGSRIRTNVVDTPRPVTVLGKDALQVRGVTHVTQALRELTFNSLGSFRDRSGNSFGQVGLVGLKGLGEDRTAVLINGRRIAGNPITGSAAVDLNTLPMSAVDRIEVLTDSASAVYGADAIGGVVNVIMRKDFTGAEVSVGRDEPDRDNAFTNRMSITLGQDTDTGHVMFSADYYKRDPIFDVDRDYSRVRATPAPDGGLPRHDVDTVGVSAGGNSAFNAPFSRAFSVGDCPEATYVPVQEPLGIEGNGCGFGYADLSMLTGGLERWSTYLDAAFEINEDHTLYLENRSTRSETFGRYAPAVGFVSVPVKFFEGEELTEAEADLYRYDRSGDGMVDHRDVNFEDYKTLDTQTTDKDGVVTSTTEGDGKLDATEFGDRDPQDWNNDGMVDDKDEQGIGLFHRFVGHGNRDESYSISEFDTVAGLRGKFDFGGFGVVNYDAFLRHYEYNVNNEGDTYVVTNLIEAVIQDGSYDFRNPASPENASAVQATAATLTRDIETEFDHFGVSFDGTNLWSLPAGDIGWALGAEWAYEKYKDQYDNAREAGNITGSAGNSSAGERERWALFGEAEVPVIEGMSVNLALRYDDYDDFGDESSPSISWRYRPTDWVTLRASWGEGFKAPNLGDVGQSLSQSFENVQDLRRCRAEGTPDEDCSASQRDEFTGGNPDLQAEKSESFNLGAIFTPIDDLVFSIDLWQVEVKGAVATLDIETLLVLEGDGALPPGVIVNRGPASGNVPGPILSCIGGVDLTTTPTCGIINVFANLATRDVQGMDIRAEYTLNTESAGQWLGKVNLSNFIKYDEQVLPGGETFERAGDASYPKNQLNVSVDWTYDVFNVNYTFHWVDSHEGGDTNASYGSWYRQDLTGTWTSATGLEVVFGVRNLTDEDPEIDSIGTGWTNRTQEISQELYTVAGRVYNTTLTWRF